MILDKKTNVLVVKKMNLIYNIKLPFRGVENYKKMSLNYMTQLYLWSPLVLAISVQLCSANINGIKGAKSQVECSESPSCEFYPKPANFCGISGKAIGCPNLKHWVQAQAICLSNEEESEISCGELNQTLILDDEKNTSVGVLCKHASPTWDALNNLWDTTPCVVTHESAVAIMGEPCVELFKPFTVSIMCI